MESAIYIHAWFWTDDDAGNGQEYQEYTDNPAIADGYCVYTRHETGIDATQGPPFDLSDEMDFPDHASAMAEAEKRHKQTGFEIREY